MESLIIDVEHILKTVNCQRTISKTLVTEVCLKYDLFRSRQNGTQKIYIPLCSSNKKYDIDTPNLRG